MTIESDHSIGQVYYEKLGRILVSFQALEESITFALISLTTTHRDDEIDLPYLYAISELSFKSRLKLLRNHLQDKSHDDFMYPGCPCEKDRPELFQQVLTKINIATVDCQKIEEKRNQYIHSVWNPSESDPKRTARRFKLRVQAKKTAVVLEEVPITELDDLLEMIENTKEMITTCYEILCSVIAEKRDSTNSENT